MKEYRDVDEIIKNDANISAAAQKAHEAFRSLFKKGNTVSFGTFEQDNNINNGTEEIEWIVVSVEGDKAILLCLYGIESMPFNDDFFATSWSNCSLRLWLNETFFQEAFSTQEIEHINKHETIPGITDSVFLLSVNDLEHYSSNNENNQCRPTAAALSSGAYVNSQNDNCCWWWLSTPGTVNDVACVNTNGEILESGITATTKNGAIRPAVEINLGM